MENSEGDRSGEREWERLRKGSGKGIIVFKLDLVRGKPSFNYSITLSLSGEGERERDKRKVMEGGR